MKKTTLRSAVGATVAVGLSAVLLPTSAWGASGTAAEQSRTLDRATLASFGRIAETVLADRTTALVQGRSIRRAASIPAAGKVRLAAALARTEDSALGSLQARKARLAALGEAYSSGRTQVALGRVRLSGTHATAEVTETTTLTYRRIHGDEPPTTGFQAHHELSFTRAANGTWQLTGIRSTDSGPAQINQPVRTASVAFDAAGPQGTPAATTWPAAAKPKPAGANGYNYTAMATYAEKYWKNYNTAYRKFNSEGGDCTNFISQALKAGGWKNVSGSAVDYHKWWYDPKTTQTQSWVGADDWSWFALSSKRAVNLANVYQLGIGDILQMDFEGDQSKDHSMIVTYRDSRGIPYVTYHQTDTYRRSVASLVAAYPRAVYYAYRT